MGPSPSSSLSPGIASLGAVLTPRAAARSAETAAAWNCACRPDCDGWIAALCLYAATVTALAEGKCSQSLLGPLMKVTTVQRTRDGQADCAALVAAVDRGDEATALAAAQRLIETAGNQLSLTEPTEPH